MASEVFHSRLRADQVSKQLRQSGTFSDRIVQWSRAERSLSALLESTTSCLYPVVGAASRDNQCGQQIHRVSR